MFRKFNLGQNLDFLAQKFKYLILYRMKYSRIFSNFGAKIQICVKVKVCQNSIWTKNLTFREVWSSEGSAGGCGGSISFNNLTFKDDPG